MIFNCVICSDIFDSASETYTTTCGHLFHYVCLIEWLERSKSCPQCRSKTTESNIHRVFFNVMNDGKEDAGSLRNQIENLKFAVQMKELEVKNAADEVKTLKKRNVKLRNEFQNFEQKVSVLELLTVSLKEQIKHLKGQVKAGEDAKEEARQLRNKLEILKNVELVVQGSVPEVEAMLSSSCCGTSESQKAMFTYSVMLKRELSAATERRREARARADALQRSLSAARAELARLREDGAARELALRQAGDDLRLAEEERQGLARKVRDLERAVASPSGDPRDRLAAGPPAPDSLKRPRLTDPSGDCLDPLGGEAPRTPVPRRKEARPSVLRGSSLLSRRTSFMRAAPGVSAEAREEAYDGLGGHSRRDDFPVPLAGARLRARVAPLRKKPSPLATLDAFIGQA
ncbi:E3 ubiquitin-protein ligase TRAIP-like isoform X2 [Bacillus rossius redtenbacheri]|uniref:E3 ubiquitin-protein ligase TRAIP-like isoform X2 n=1 Tax=Bacillus rossius redtenbacheri TaxID=93214 RepID=UPI002FDDF241